MPDGLSALHSCDNPPYVNPAHLFHGTDADNSHDKVAKGRQNRGSRHGHAKLTETVVREMRRRILAGERKADLACEYGVSKWTLFKIASGHTWRHVS